MFCLQVQVLAIQILLTSHHLLLSADAAIVQPAAYVFRSLNRDYSSQIWTPILLRNGLGDLSATNSTKANVTLNWFDAATNRTTQNNLPLFELTGLGLGMAVSLTPSAWKSECSTYIWWYRQPAQHFQPSSPNSLMIYSMPPRLRLTTQSGCHWFLVTNLRIKPRR